MSVATKRVRCCVICSECGDCYTTTLYELRDLLKAIHIEIADYAQSFAQRINDGYACVKLNESAVDTLLYLKETITRYYHALRTKVMSCLCNAEFQRVKEQVGNIIDLFRCSMSKETDIRYDYSQYDQWVAANPTCVSYDVWEKGLIACNPPSFIISATKGQRDSVTLFAIASKDTSGCVMKLLAYANKAKCEHKLVASATDTNKCKIELKALTTKHNCDMSLSQYSSLLACNLSFNVISTVLGCGGRFSLDASGAPIVKIGAKSSKIDDVVKLAGGTYQDMNETEFNSIYG